jgi:hypothetical protein
MPDASTELPDLEARFLPELDDKGATGGECQAPYWVALDCGASVFL